MRKFAKRSAAHQVLRGARPGIIRDDGWSGRAEQAPLLDEASTRYPSKRKRRDRKPKERCPARQDGHHTHEWMKDTEEVPIHKYVFVKDETYTIDGELYVFPKWKYVQVGTKEQQYRLCAHCGKTQIRVHARWRLWNGRKSYWS